MARRKTIPEGNDPLSAILGGAMGSKSPPPPGRGRPRAATPEPEAAEVVLPKVRVGFDLTIDLSEAIRDCVVFLQGLPYHLDMSKFAQEPCREIERLPQEAQRGGRLPEAPAGAEGRPSGGVAPRGGSRTSRRVAR